MLKKENKKSVNSALMEKIVSLCKRRGFIFPGSEIYGGLANAWDYGPYGVTLKNNIKQEWWRRFVQARDDMVGLDAAIIMNPKTWEASGHLDNFSDPLVECEKCHKRFRANDVFIEHINRGTTEGRKYVQESMIQGIGGEQALDKLISELGCVDCGGVLGKSRQFNLMFKTFIGPAEETANIAYLRPETAQGIFVNFKNILDTTRKKLPFGIGQIGKAFRNEITPGNFVFRTREFEQMEIEYFIRGDEWKKHFDLWKKDMEQWMKDLGLDMKKAHAVDVPDGERSHYSKRTIDFEYEFPFGQKELYGLAYRTDYDLTQHMKHSGEKLRYTDEDGATFVPHVIEPSLGVERTVLAVLCAAYTEEQVSDEERVVLKLSRWLVPVQVAVFPLLKNKPELVAKAREIFNDLKMEFRCEFDDNGNVGKRYRRQDEIGTPFCVTVDFDSLEDKAVTVRDRDTMQQERVAIDELQKFFAVKFL